MFELLIKGVVSGALVVAATEASRRSTAAAAILVSLPLTSIIALAVLWLDTGDERQVIDLSWAILWIVLPSVVLFIALPVLMKLGIAFWPALAASCAVMAVTYVAYAKVLDHFGLG
jgi:hypothetical protein